MLASAPPLKMFRNPRTVLFSKMLDTASGFTPGTGTFDTNLKMIRIMNVKRSFSRISGWPNACTAACSSCGRCLSP